MSASRRLQIDDGIARFLAAGVSKALLVRPLGVALAFAAHAALANLMGVAEYGTFIYVYFWTYLLGLAARLGLDRAAVRFGTAYLAVGDFASFRALVRHSFQVALGLGTLGGLGMGLVAAAWPASDEPDWRGCLAIGACLIPLLAAHNVYEGIAQALKRVLQATVPEQVLRQALLGTFGGVAYVALGSLTAVDAMLAYGVATLVTLGIDWAWYRRVRPPELARVGIGAVDPAWLPYAFQMSAVTLIGVWILQADLMVVGVMLGPAAAGHYSVAARIASLVAWVGVSATLIFGPIIVELSKDSSTERLQRYARLVARGMGIAAASIAAAVWLLREPLLGLFGPTFLVAAAPLGILLCGNVVRECFGPAPALLNLSGHHGVTLRILVACALLNLAANVVLTGLLGAPGAALSTALTVIGYSAAFWAFLRRRSGIDSAAFAR